MTRPFLLTTCFAFALASSGFAAAIVHKGSLALHSPTAAAARLMPWRDADRASATPEAFMASNSFSLATLSAASCQTLSGVQVVGSGSDIVFSRMASGAQAEERVILLGASEFQSADAVGSTVAEAGTISTEEAAPQKLGSASAFAATAQVPEPSSLLLAGMGALAFLRRRRA